MPSKKTLPSAAKSVAIKPIRIEDAFQVQQERSLMEGESTSITSLPESLRTEFEFLRSRNELLEREVAKMAETITTLTARLKVFEDREQTLKEHEMNFPPLAARNWAPKSDQSHENNVAPKAHQSHEGTVAPKPLTRHPNKKRVKIDNDEHLRLIVEGKPLKNNQLKWLYVKMRRQRISNVKAALEYIGIDRKPIRHITFVADEMMELCVFAEKQEEIAAAFRTKGCHVYPLETTPATVHLLLEMKNDLPASSTMAMWVQQRLDKEVEMVDKRALALKTLLKMEDDSGLLSGVKNAYKAVARTVKSQTREEAAQKPPIAHGAH